MIRITQVNLASKHGHGRARMASAVMLFLTIVFACSAARGRESQPPEHLAQAASANSKVWNLHSKKLAIEQYLTASASWRSAEPRKAADVTRNAAAIALELRDFETARTLLDRSLLIEQNENYPEGKILSLSLYVEVELRAGNTDAAEAALKKANSVTLSALHAEAEAARAFANAGWEYFKYNLPETIRLARQARELWTLADNPSRQIEANSLIAYAHGGLYEPLEAEERVDESLELARRTGDERARAIILVQKAFVLLLMNEPVKALSVCTEAETLFPDDLDLGEQAQLANGMGGIYWLLGDLKMSNTYTLRAFELFGREQSPKGQLATLVSLTELAFAGNDPEQGFAYHRQAETLSKQLRNDYFLALADRFVANHYLSLGDADRAIENYQKSLRRLTDAGFKSGISSIHSNLGESYLKRNDLDLAREHFEAAHDINRRVSNRFAEAQSLFDLARVSKAEGDIQRATDLISQSIAVTETLRDKVLDQKLRSEYFATVNDRYGFGIDALLRKQQTAQSLTLAERARARETIENLVMAHAGVFADADKEIVDRERRVRISLNAKADKLTDVLQAGSDEASASALEHEIAELQRQMEEIKTELKQKSPIYSAVKDPPEFDVNDFQANVLGEEDVLLEYFLGKEESYLWVVAKNEFTAVVLPGREPIEAKVEKLRQLLDAGKPLAGETFQQLQERVARASAEYGTESRELSEMILGPAADKLTGKRLIIVPDGRLHHFPISALPMPKSGSDDPILLTNEVVYQPSAQTLSLLAKFRTGAVDKPTRDLLVFSDPVFSRDDSRLSGVDIASAGSGLSALRLRFAESLEGLQRLPSSGQEASEIAGIVGGRRTDVFSGFDATREQLFSVKLSDYKVIHLATHGLVNQERPELSAVILSRFDENGRPLDESVRLQDIYAMKLNADLVVLSACQTASGKEIKGEGVLGLNNAFLQAGAGSVVATLWPVDDHASNMLMREFYAGMANGHSVSSALRNAQLALYRDPQFRSPFFWAAFTLHGDMNRQPAIGTGISMWWFAALPALLVTGLLARRRFFQKRS